MSCSADDPTMARRPRHPPPSYGCNRRPCPATVRNHRLHRRNPAVLMSYITILTKSIFLASTAAMPYRGRASGPAAWARCPIRPHICAGLSARGNASPTAPHDDPSRWQDMQRIALNDTGASMVPGQSGIKRKQVSGFREPASCALVREYESSSHKHHRERLTALCVVRIIITHRIIVAGHDRDGPDLGFQQVLLGEVQCGGHHRNPLLDARTIDMAPAKPLAAGTHHRSTSQGATQDRGHMKNLWLAQPTLSKLADTGRHRAAGPDTGADRYRDTSRGSPHTQAAHGSSSSPTRRRARRAGRADHSMRLRRNCRRRDCSSGVSR